MKPKPRISRIDRLRDDKLLNRIAKRYDELDKMLQDLEAKLRDDDENEPDKPTTLRKPR